MKRKTISLALAAALLASLAGCAAATPASVGSIGDIDIPAGVYLLVQYNAYNTVSGLVELGEGETVNDVKAVLKAEATGTIGDEEVTASGQEYLAKQTLHELEYYAAVETTFAELGGTLDEAEIAEVSADVDSLWESNGELYAANGIGRASVENYLLCGHKAEKILEMQYGDDGLTPVTDKEYEDFLHNECYYLDSFEMPLLDYSTYAMADEDQTKEIEDLAKESVKALQEAELPAGSSTEVTAELTDVAKEYLPKAYEVLGSTFDAAQAAYYVTSQLYLPGTIANYASEDGNMLTDPFDAADGDWTSANVGLAILVGRQSDPLASHTLEELKTSYSLLGAVKGDDLQQDFYAQGAALAHDLSQSAMDTYKAANIKRTV